MGNFSAHARGCAWSDGFLARSIVGMHLEVLEALGLQQKRDFSDKFSMCKIRLNSLDQRWSIAHFN